MSTVPANAESIRAGRRSRRSTASILVGFLGSMNLAITLLVVIAIASVIGTVLQQNQPFQDYLIKFGPFWFNIFERLSLYDVYAAPWYLLILAFLVVSTSICLARNTPNMLKEMNRFREHQQERSLRAFSNHREWQTDLPTEEVEALATRALKRNGYRIRRKEHGDALLLAGMTGSSNRIGYILTHLSIVVICVGGLIDGNLMLKFREWSGDLVVETRDIPVSRIGAESRVSAGAAAFRGTVNIPEGGRAGVVFLPLRDGYVVQELPFTIELEEFRVEHHDTGEPRLFESDVVITAPELEEPIRQTIAVNHPLIYNGYAIYQSGFGDGGSRLYMRAWPLAGDDRAAYELEGRVLRDDLELEVAGQSLRLELTEFETFNARRVPGVPGSREVENLGPRFEYRLRAADGTAREFRNYMRPVTIDDRRYFLSGVRSSPAEEFRFLHLPADADDSPELFMAFLDALTSEERLREASMRAAADAMDDFGLTDRSLIPQVAASGRELVQRLLDEGFGSAMEHLRQRIAEAGGVDDSQETLVMFSRMVMERTLWEAYRDALAATGDDPQRELGGSDQVFFQDAISAMPAIKAYGAPVFLQLRDYDHRQASGLQIARAPGQNVVYLGFALLVGGIFLLFYVSHRRMWCWIRRHDTGTMVLLAGTNQRDPLGFAGQYRALADEIDHRLQDASAPVRGNNEVEGL